MQELGHAEGSEGAFSFPSFLQYVEYSADTLPQVPSKLRNFTQKIQQLLSGPHVSQRDEAEAVIAALHLSLHSCPISAALRVHAVRLTEIANTPLVKRLGYVACDLLLRHHSDMKLLLLNTILKDLRSHDELIFWAGCTAARDLLSRDMSDDVAQVVISRLRHASPRVKQLCVLTLSALEAQSEVTLFLIRDPSPVVMAAAVHCACAARHALTSSQLREAGSALRHVLRQLSEGALTRYFSAGAGAAALQHDLLTLLTDSAQHDSEHEEDREELLLRLHQLYSSGGPSSHGLLLSWVMAVTSHPLRQDCPLAEPAVATVASFLSSTDPNLKLAGVQAAGQLLHHRIQGVSRLQNLILRCLDHPDPTVSSQTTQVLLQSVGPHNVSRLFPLLLRRALHGRTDTGLEKRLLNTALREAPDIRWLCDQVSTLLLSHPHLLSTSVLHRLQTAATSLPLPEEQGGLANKGYETNEGKSSLTGSGDSRLESRGSVDKRESSFSSSQESRAKQYDNSESSSQESPSADAASEEAQDRQRPAGSDGTSLQKQEDTSVKGKQGSASTSGSEVSRGGANALCVDAARALLAVVTRHGVHTASLLGVVLQLIRRIDPPAPEVLREANALVSRLADHLGSPSTPSGADADGGKDSVSQESTDRHCEIRREASVRLELANWRLGGTAEQQACPTQDWLACMTRDFRQTSVTSRLVDDTQQKPDLMETLKAYARRTEERGAKGLCPRRVTQPTTSSGGGALSTSAGPSEEAVPTSLLDDPLLPPDLADSAKISLPEVSRVWTLRGRAAADGRQQTTPPSSSQHEHVSGGSRMENVLSEEAQAFADALFPAD